MFRTFGISDDENILAFEGILKDDKNLKNDKILYIYEQDMDGKFVEITQIDYESESDENDFMTNIFIQQIGDVKEKKYLITGISEFTRHLYCFMMENKTIRQYMDPIEVKSTGVIKSTKWYENGIFCIGGDDNVTFIEVKKDSDEGSVMKKSVGRSSRLNIGIKRKKRKGFL